MRCWRWSLGATVALVFVTAARADLEGRVTLEDGTPVEGAFVVHVGSLERRTTDSRGRFAFRGLTAPAVLRVEDARFEPLERTLETSPGTLTVVPMHPVVVEDVVVTAHHRDTRVAPPRSMPATDVVPEELPAPPASAVEMATTTPGVATAGQGGRFQAYSIRGIAGQRVLTAVADVRIVAERRAGATASFVLPALLEAVEIVRGPASTVYGSGSLGGVVHALPRRFEGYDVEAGWASQGNDRFANLGWGADGWSVGLATRHADDAETPHGTELPSAYEQWSAALQKSWTLASGAAIDLLAMPAVARDVGKPNARYPQRITRYPEEDHLLLKLGATLPQGWRFAVWAHPNDLLTENLRADSRSVVDNEAFDFGANARREVSFGDGWQANVGLDLFARHGVLAEETLRDLGAGTTTRVRTLDGREDQATLHGTVRRPLGSATVELGASITGIEQRNLDSDAVSDVAGAGFAGVTVPLGGGFELAANAGTGIRFPSLTERYFSGSTGAGSVVANADLDPERALSLDLGARWFGSRLFVELFAFRNEIDDYIEQVEIADGVTGFANLAAGTIEGFELGGTWVFGPHGSVNLSAMQVDGASDTGDDLAEIPAARIALGADFEHGGFRVAGRIEQRFEKDDPGPSEVPTRSAELLSATLGYRVAAELVLSVFGTNLLDETYTPSADELAVAEPGRSVGLSLRWTRD